jgi:hypothetical protein
VIAEDAFCGKPVAVTNYKNFNVNKRVSARILA